MSWGWERSERAGHQSIRVPLQGPPTPPAAPPARVSFRVILVVNLPFGPRGSTVSPASTNRSGLRLWPGRTDDAQKRIEPLHVGGGAGRAADGLKRRDLLLYDLHARLAIPVGRQEDR